MSLRVLPQLVAAPVNAFSLWKPESVKITKGESNVGVYHKTEASHRKFCKLAAATC